MDIYDDRSPSPSQNLCGSSPAWDNNQINAGFANQSMEVNPPASLSSPAYQIPPPRVPPTTPQAASQPKGASETPKINSLKRKHPLEMLKDINESVQRVKVETIEIQARSKFEREKLRIAAEKERDLRQLDDARERREHERFMAERQLEMLRLQAAVAGAGGVVPELPK
jgi:hypothetical protein